MSQIIIAWIAVAFVFVAADALWLSQAGPRLYRPLIGEIMSDKLDVAAVVAFYVIYISGIVFFAVSPALDQESLGMAVVNGAVLGFIAYATYDLSNQATLKSWDWRLTLTDMAWGAFATGLASALSYSVASRIT
jgi:uncharacterized membrane protein